MTIIPNRQLNCRYIYTTLHPIPDIHLIDKHSFFYNTIFIYKSSKIKKKKSNTVSVSKYLD